jgi:hypothetical protein
MDKLHLILLFDKSPLFGLKLLCYLCDSFIEHCLVLDMPSVFGCQSIDFVVFLFNCLGLGVFDTCLDFDELLVQISDKLITAAKFSDQLLVPISCVFVHTSEDSAFSFDLFVKLF